MPRDTKHNKSDLAAKPTSTSIGAPRIMPKLLPVIRLLAAAVSNLGSISLSNNTPDDIVPVSMPNIDINP